eukprot:2489585-Lingulodinium_polyedra.AAC.1
MVSTRRRSSSGRPRRTMNGGEWKPSTGRRGRRLAPRSRRRRRPIGRRPPTPGERAPRGGIAGSRRPSRTGPDGSTNGS